jgi:hypothetical protein
MIFLIWPGDSITNELFAKTSDEETDVRNRIDSPIFPRGATAN